MSLNYYFVHIVHSRFTPSDILVCVEFATWRPCNVRVT